MLLQDPFSIACHQHAPLRWLMARLRTSNPDHVRTLLFDEFADALGKHLQAIDSDVLPLLRGFGRSTAVHQYVDAHWYLKRNLAELTTMDRHGEAFRKRLWAVIRQLERQLGMESTELPHVLHSPAAPRHPVVVHAR